MRSLSKPADLRHSYVVIGALVCLTLLFGGGGVRYGLANLVVQLAALIILSLNRQSFFLFWQTAPYPLKLLISASLLLPIIHLIPLPPEIWRSLPGREVVAETYSLIGTKDAWTSLSVDPARSWVALNALVIPLTILAVGWSLDYSRLVQLGWLVAFLGLGNVLLGVPQVLSSGATGLFYPETPMPGVLFGTFANRNSTGIFLVCALCFIALLPSPITRHDVLITRV